MFTIKSSQAPSKKSVQKHFMKIVSVKFSKDEFCSKKEVTRFYKDNYKILGIPLEINNKDYWNENDDFYYIQACDLFKQPDSTYEVEIHDGVKLIFAPQKMVIKDEAEVRKLEEKVKQTLSD